MGCAPEGAVTGQHSGLLGPSTRQAAFVLPADRTALPFAVGACAG